MFVTNFTGHNSVSKEVLPKDNVTTNAA
uniref:Uncharacterized protein n=1 Tax=Arundo donax TaxID=35708 RepID=A0A0A8Y3Y4_ARUDO